MEEMLWTVPTILLMGCWPWFMTAQVGFFVVAMLVFLLWPRYPKWLLRPYVILAPTEALGLLLFAAIVGMTIDYPPLG